MGRQPRLCGRTATGSTRSSGALSSGSAQRERLRDHLRRGADATGRESRINIAERVPREFVLMIPSVLTTFAARLGGLRRCRSHEAETGYTELRGPDS